MVERNTRINGGQMGRGQVRKKADVETGRREAENKVKKKRARGEAERNVRKERRRREAETNVRKKVSEIRGKQSPKMGSRKEKPKIRE